MIIRKKGGWMDEHQIYKYGVYKTICLWFQQILKMPDKIYLPDSGLD